MNDTLEAFDYRADIERMLAQHGFEPEIEALIKWALLPARKDKLAGLNLTKLEGRIMARLFLGAGETVRREALLEAMYFDVPDDKLPQPKILDVLLVRLRKKIAATKYRLETIWGVGVKLRELDNAETT